MLDRRIIVVTVVSILCISLALFWVLTPSTTPWTDTGRLTLLVRATPGLSENILFGIGIDNIELYKSDGGIERVTILNRRVQLQPGSDQLSLVLDTKVPVGTYSGFGFSIKSPEVRNAWQQDIAPEYVNLLAETVRLDVSYQIEKDINSSIILGFETTQAVHKKETEQYFLPVIQIETRRGATVKEQNGEMIVSGGIIEHSATFGMNWNGEMRFNYREKKPVPVAETTKTEERIQQTTELDTPSPDDQATSSTSTPTDDTGTTTAQDAEATTTTSGESL